MAVSVACDRPSGSAFAGSAPNIRAFCQKPGENSGRIGTLASVGTACAFHWSHTAGGAAVERAGGACAGAAELVAFRPDASEILGPATQVKTKSAPRPSPS